MTCVFVMREIGRCDDARCDYRSHRCIHAIDLLLARIRTSDMCTSIVLPAIHPLAFSSFERGANGFHPARRKRCLPPILPPVSGTNGAALATQALLSSLPDSSVQRTYDNDDAEAISQFGTKEYWDDMYNGMGDFPSDEYQWYFGWSELKGPVTDHIPDRSSRVLVPGVGNDPILIDLVGAGYYDLTAFDYSEGAMARQRDLLEFGPASVHESVDVLHLDARALPGEWAGKFDAILEKGALDAMYLSGGDNLRLAAEELRRVLRPGGTFISVSGVVPEEMRREMFSDSRWEWVRDGSDDLKAGCFVWRKI